MSKAQRKPRPFMPHWWWCNNDGCWDCKNSTKRTACSSCWKCKEAAKATEKLSKKRDLIQKDYRE